jgi:t-SNARE complex subunit (syntaxin)
MYVRGVCNNVYMFLTTPTSWISPKTTNNIIHNTTKRVRENMNTTLTKKFVDEMKIYQQAQQQYKTDIKKKVKRQVQVVKPDATDEDVDQVMKSEGGKDALLRQSILAGGVNDQIK